MAKHTTPPYCFETSCTTRRGKALLVVAGDFVLNAKAIINTLPIAVHTSPTLKYMSTQVNRSPRYCTEIQGIFSPLDTSNDKAGYTVTFWFDSIHVCCSPKEKKKKRTKTSKPVASQLLLFPHMHEMKTPAPLGEHASPSFKFKFKKKGNHLLMSFTSSLLLHPFEPKQETLLFSLY